MKEIVTASILFAISIFFIYKSIRAGQVEFDLAWHWFTKIKKDTQVVPFIKQVLTCRKSKRSTNSSFVLLFIRLARLG